VLEGLNRPVNLGIAADGSGRLFIIEQAGLVRVLFNGELLPAPFLDIRASVGSSGNEQGLLGIAFHPDYADNGLFFVNYTARDGATTISRFQVDVAMAPESQAADPASEQVILRIPQPQANHNGGHLLFGPDGMLYIGMGDGGGAGDPNRNAQNLQSPLGKLLRIDVDSAQPYAIPPGNPFTVGGGLPEIWAYGLRNPWGIAFDPQTGGLFIADVGQNAWEEIDHLPAGFGGVPANFGWDLLEGEQPYRQDGFPLPADLVPPAFVYGHDQGCSVTGGQVYRGRELPAFTGVYLFGDFCSGTVWGLLPDGSGGWRGQVLFQTPHRISSIASGAQGELYLLDIRGGLYRLVDR
jgi:glucose/arabinose dehydrogenase